MKTWKLAVAIIALSLTAFAQTSRYDNYAWTTQFVNGVSVVKAVTNAQINVCPKTATSLPCSAVSVYSDQSANNIYLLTQPLLSDASGAFGFWAAPGTYVYFVTVGGITNGPYPLSIAPGLDAVNAFTAPNTFSNINTTRYAAAFTGSDIGAQVNATVADFGASPACGEIDLPAGYFTYSTPISFGARNGCWLKGAGRGGTQGNAVSGNGGTQLVYTGTGDAIQTTAASYRMKLSDFTVAKGGGSATVGIEVINSFYTTIRDVSVDGFATNIKLNGGGAFGLNVAILEQVDSQNATTNALWLTGTGVVGQGAYNVQVIGGHYNCASTTATNGILIDQQSTNNQIYAPLVNNCAFGIRNTSSASTSMNDVSAQGNTVGIQNDSNSDSHMISMPYFFSNGTNIVDNSTNSNILGNQNSTGNRLNGPIQVAPFNSTTHPQKLWMDTDAGGFPRIRLEAWNAGVNFNPYYIKNVSGTLHFTRCDLGVPVAPGADGVNCASALTIDASKAATFNGAVTFTTGTTGTTLALTGGTAPVVGSPTVGQVACFKAAGPPVVIGFCTGAVSGTSSCTCN